MSTDELIAKILILLRKQEDISVRVSFSTVKKGTITTISIKESTGIQKNQFSSRKSTKKPEEKKKVKKNPSRKKRDEKRLQNFLSRNCERGLSSEAAATTPADPPATPQFPDPTTRQDPSTTPRPSDTPPIPPDSPTPQPPDLSATPPSMASRRKTKAGRFRGLEKTGAGNEERTVWRPAVLSPIPQLDGSTNPQPPETTTTPPVPATTPQPPASDQPLTPQPVDPATTPLPPASDPSLTPRPSDPSDDHEEEVSNDETDASEEVFCIHNVKINTSNDRPECKKCRRKYGTDCPHYTKRPYKTI